MVPRVYEAIQIAADHKAIGVLDTAMELAMYKSMSGERGRQYEMALEYHRDSRYEVGQIAENTDMYLLLLS